MMDRSIQTAGVLVGAIAMSVILFAVIGTVVAGRSAGGAVSQTLLLGIVSASVFAMIGSVLYRRLSYQPLRLRRIYETSGESGLS